MTSRYVSVSNIVAVLSFAGSAVKMPSTLVALNMASALISSARSAAAESVVEKGLPGAGRKDHYARLFEMANRASPDEGLGYLVHSDRDARFAISKRRA